MKKVAVFGDATGGKSTLARRLAELTRRILDGFGCVTSAWERFAPADTWIYIDLPLLTPYRWFTKQLVQGLFSNPGGWPEGNPIWSSTLESYRVVGRCHRLLTPRDRKPVADAAAAKRVHHPRSPAEMSAFLTAIEQERR